MIEFPAGRFRVQVDAADGRVGVTVVDKYGDSIRASLLPQIAADLGQAIQRAATEAGIAAEGVLTLRSHNDTGPVGGQGDTFAIDPNDRSDHV